MNTISFNTANFVAREIGYDMPNGWGQGDTAANDWFRPINSYAERFDAMLAEIDNLGFKAVDLWAAHLNSAWATPEHIAIANGCLSQRNMTVSSYACGGSTIPEFRASCRVSALIEAPVIGVGSSLLDTDRKGMAATLREFGVVFGYENHPEKSAKDILTKIGDSDPDVIGAAVDTGWFGTQSFDALQALREIGPRIKIIHLKDVKARRSQPSRYPMIDMGHETCRYGAGIVNIKGCVDVLKEIGYQGPISIEHEPEDFDPRPDVAASKKMLDEWLAS